MILGVPGTCGCCDILRVAAKEGNGRREIVNIPRKCSDVSSIVRVGLRVEWSGYLWSLIVIVVDIAIAGLPRTLLLSGERCSHPVHNFAREAPCELVDEGRWTRFWPLGMIRNGVDVRKQSSRKRVIRALGDKVSFGNKG